MLVTEKLHLNLEQITEQDQVLTLTGMTWKEFESLISEELSYRISYRDGEITIVSPGRKHENIKQLSGDLIIAFCDMAEIDYYHFGSTTLKNPPLVGKEPDNSYAIGANSDLPNIAIEVNHSSGSIQALTIYLELGVKEVWLWNKRDELSLYVLQGDRYTQQDKSSVLPALSADIIEKYVGLMRDGNPRIIKKQFLKELFEGHGDRR